MDITVVSIVGGPDLGLLPHWLAHYRSLGLDKFAVAVNDSDRAEDYDRLLAEGGVNPVFHLDDLFLRYEIPARNRLNAYAGAWILHADLDELFVFDRPLGVLLADCEAGGYQAVRGRFVDHLQAGGELPAVRPSPSLWQQFPLMHPLTRCVRRGCDDKMVLRHRSLPAGVGNHISAGFYGPEVRYHPAWQEVHHFRWTASTTPAIRHVLEVWPTIPHRHEYENVLRFLGEPPRLDLARLRELAPFLEPTETLLGNLP
jgi:hypothetical protein